MRFEGGGDGPPADGIGERGERAGVPPERLQVLELLCINIMYNSPVAIA